MNRKGFAIIETLIVVTMLTVALLMIHSSYKAQIIEEEKRLYYDDVSYIFKTSEVKKFITQRVDLESLAKSQKYIYELINNKELFYSDIYYNEYLALKSSFNIESIFLVSSDLTKIKSCTYESIHSDSDECYQENISLTYEKYEYLKTIDTSVIHQNYILVVSYKTNKDGSSCEENCVYNYANLGIEVKNEI